MRSAPSRGRPGGSRWSGHPRRGGCGGAAPAGCGRRWRPACPACRRPTRPCGRDAAPDAPAGRAAGTATAAAPARGRPGRSSARGCPARHRRRPAAYWRPWPGYASSSLLPSGHPNDPAGRRGGCHEPDIPPRPAGRRRRARRDARLCRLGTRPSATPTRGCRCWTRPSPGTGCSTPRWNACEPGIPAGTRARSGSVTRGR